MKGQVTLLLTMTLGLLFAALLGITALLHDGQRQWQLQNIADNAAASAATVLARDLNFLALTNRALLANQVAMAQLVGLASWYAMLEDGSQRLAIITRIIPYLNVFTQKVSMAVTKLQTVIDNLLRVGLQAQRLLVQTLSMVQRLTHIAFTTLAVKTVAEVVEAHDVDVTWNALHSPGVVPAPVLWWQQVRSVSTASEAGKSFADMARASRDPFSKNRTYTWFDLGITRVEKTGGSDLVVDHQGRWNWQAIDTTAIHQKILFWSFEFPWARGSRQQSGATSFSRAKTAYGNSRKVNPGTTGQAARLTRSTGNQASFNFYRLTEPTRAIPSIIVAVTDSAKNLNAYAKAVVSYSRPQRIFPRKDKLYERANLLNPLWYSRLTSLSNLDKLVLAARQTGQEES